MQLRRPLDDKRAAVGTERLLFLGLDVVGVDHPHKEPLTRGNFRGKVPLKKVLELQSLFDCFVPSTTSQGRLGLDADDCDFSKT